MSNTHVIRFRALPFVLLATLVSCSEGSSPMDPDAQRFEAVACPAFGLTSTSGTPLEKIGIGTLPASFQSPVAAAMFGADGEVDGFAYVQPNEDTGALELSVPLHPAEPLSGGTVTFTFTDGTRACPAVNFTIEPLPAADGEFAAVVDLLQDVLTEQAAALETTPAELNALLIEDVPKHALPVAMLQALVDYPGNDLSLKAQLNGGLGAAELDLMDRLLARTGLRASLEAAAPVPVNSMRSGPARLTADDLLCSTTGVTDAQGLDYCMALAAELQRSATGLSREVANDIKQVFSDLAGGENQIPIAREVKFAFGLFFFIIYSEREAAAGVYPSKFISMDLSTSEEPIREDDEAPATISAGVIAASLGYDMEAQILEAISLAKDLVNTYSGLYSDLGGDTLTTDQQGFVDEVLTPQIKDRINNLDIGSLQIPAEVFPRIELRDSLWLDARVVTGNAVEVIDGAHYEGREFGSATLSVRTKDGKFGGAQIAEQMEVSVSQVRVTISPDDQLVTAGNPWSFEAKVIGAKYPDRVEVNLPASRLQGTATMTYDFDTTYTVDYVAPLTPDLSTTDLLVVWYPATTGALYYSNIQPAASATIRFGGIRIVTDPTCLDPGEPLQLEGSVADNGNEQIVWSASAGTIDETSGYFVAPPEATLVTITAALASNPDVKATLELQVGGCSCQATVTVGGQDAGATRQARFYLSDDLSGVTHVDWGGGVVGPDQSSAYAAFFGGDLDNAVTVPFGTTGTYSVGLTQGAIRNVPFLNPDDVNNPSIPLTSITITENEGGNVFAGTVSGQVGMFNAGDLEPVSFNMTFRIEADPAYSSDTVRMCRADG